MKKIFTFTLVLVCTHLMIIHSAQAQEDAKARKMLVGLWKIYEFESSFTADDNTSEEEKALLEAEMKEMREKSSFNFMKDGKYEIKMGMAGLENKEAGTWKVENRYIVKTDDLGNVSKLEILEKSKAMVILWDGEIRLTLVSKYFKE